MSSTNQQSPPSQTEAIEKKIRQKEADAIGLRSDGGGVDMTKMADVMEFAKLMAVASVAVPPHLRNSPGACLAVCIQAVEWRMSPFAVANKSYVVNDRLAFESQLIHAVIEQRAPLVGRLRHEFTGEGDMRRCRVWAFAKGESDVLEYTSPPFAKILPKNSPLWKTKPDVQLYYNTSRDWARIYFPDVILGVYSDDELLDAKPMPAPLQVGRTDLRTPKELPKPTNGTPEQSAADEPAEPAPDQGDACETPAEMFPQTDGPHGERR